jgi:hypothetical protein
MTDLSKYANKVYKIIITTTCWMTTAKTINGKLTTN